MMNKGHKMMPYFYKKNTGEGVLKGSIKVIRQ